MHTDSKSPTVHMVTTLPSSRRGIFHIKIATFFKRRRASLKDNEGTDSSYFCTPLSEAMKEVYFRRNHTDLLKQVTEYLQGDIPPHFSSVKPVLCLSRHVASPNFETLKFIESAKPYNVPVIISEDHSGKLTSNNLLKRSLGKMSIVKGINRNHDEIIENFTIIDFDSCDGESFGAIKTSFDLPLIDFHHSLFRQIYPNEVIIADESSWIDRNYRYDILEQYKRILSLFLVHGVMCENYYPSDEEFIRNVLRPAFDFVTKKFGYRPLIYNLVDEKMESENDWYMYPSVLYPFLQQAIGGVSKK